MGKQIPSLINILPICSVRNGVPHISVVMGWLCCSLEFSLLRSSIMCIRGLRSRSKHPCVPPAVDLAVVEGHLSPYEQ